MFLTWEDGARPVSPRTRRCRSGRSAERLTARSSMQRQTPQRAISPPRVRRSRESIVPRSQRRRFRDDSCCSCSQSVVWDSQFCRVLFRQFRQPLLPSPRHCRCGPPFERRGSTAAEERGRRSIQCPTCWCETSSWQQPMQVMDGWPVMSPGSNKDFEAVSVARHIFKLDSPLSSSWRRARPNRQKHRRRRHRARLSAPLPVDRVNHLPCQVVQPLLRPR